MSQAPRYNCCAARDSDPMSQRSKTQASAEFGEGSLESVAAKGMKHVEGESIGTGDLGVERGAGAGRALLGGRIEGHKAKARAPALGPLKVVHQRPMEVAAQVEAAG